MRSGIVVELNLPIFAERWRCEGTVQSSRVAPACSSSEIIGKVVVFRHRITGSRRGETHWREIMGYAVS